MLNASPPGASNKYFYLRRKNMAVTHLTKENFDASVASGKVVVDFWATWCGPCRMQSPILDQFAAAHPEVSVCKVDVDEQPELAARFGVMNIPTLLFFVDGKLANKAVGLQSLDRLAAAMGV